MTGLDTIAVTTMSESRTLAVVLESPCPEMRNGKPQSIVNMLAENCDVKCDHSPSRVPGTSHAARRVRPSARNRSSSRCWSTQGLSLTTSTSAKPVTTPKEAATAYDGVQPKACSAAARGPAAASAPS